MAQYEISATPLIKASDEIFVIANSICALREQYDDILSGLPECLYDTRQQLASNSGAIEEIGLCVKSLGQTLEAVVEIYAQAEQNALNDDDSIISQQVTAAVIAPQLITPAPVTPRPLAGNTHGVLLSSGLVLPDWIQAAVLEYYGQPQLDMSWD